MVFFVLALTIGIVGCVYTRASMVQAEQEKRNELFAIADMQVTRIAGWRQEHLADAIALRDDPFAAPGVGRFLSDPAAAATAQEVLSWFDALQEEYEYESILLLDAQGTVRLSAGPDEAEALESCETALAMEALRGKQVIFSDFYRHASTGAIHLGLFVPLLPQEPGCFPAGVLVLRIDPHQFFYKLVQSWPVPSRTAENLLVRREGDEALFLNELRHRQDAALSLRLPADEQRLAAAMAARGEEGVAETFDYRGVPVLAAVRAVPGSNWFLVAKVDLEEIYAPIRDRARLTILLIGALIAAAGAITDLLWRQQQARFYRWRYEVLLPALFVTD